MNQTQRQAEQTIQCVCTCLCKNESLRVSLAFGCQQLSGDAERVRAPARGVSQHRLGQPSPPVPAHLPWPGIGHGSPNNGAWRTPRQPAWPAGSVGTRGRGEGRAWTPGQHQRPAGTAGHVPSPATAWAHGPREGGLGRGLQAGPGPPAGPWPSGRAWAPSRDAGPAAARPRGPSSAPVPWGRSEYLNSCIFKDHNGRKRIT